MKLGYCPLSKIIVPFTVIKDFKGSSVICLVGNEKGKTQFGNTCEHLIMIPEERLQEFMNMSEEKIADYYGMEVE